jgi:hypothetical protein
MFLPTMEVSSLGICEIGRFSPRPMSAHHYPILPLTIKQTAQTSIRHLTSLIVQTAAYAVANGTLFSMMPALMA